MNETLLLVEPRGQATGLFAGLKAARLKSGAAIRTAWGRQNRGAVWIVPSNPAVELLLRVLPHSIARDQRILSLQPAHNARRNLLQVLFRFVVAESESSRLLPMEELVTVLGCENRADLFIGGAVAQADSAVILYRGDLEPVVVPFGWFKQRTAGPKPDFDQLAITDYGQSVRLGDYEAAADAILYEFDEEYRRRAKKRQVESDRSLSGALRRLRLQKGLRQSDFPGVGAKVIARIERGEVKNPHKQTLAAIAKRLGVPAEKIITY